MSRSDVADVAGPSRESHANIVVTPCADTHVPIGLLSPHYTLEDLPGTDDEKGGNMIEPRIIFCLVNAHWVIGYPATSQDIYINFRHCM